MTEILKKARTVLIVIAFLWAGLYMLCAQMVVWQFSTLFKLPALLASKSEIMYFPGNFIGIILILAIVYACRKIKINLSLTMAVITLVLLAVIPRYYLLHNVSIEQTSDYVTYYVNTISILENFSVAPDWQLYFSAAAANVPIICGIFALGFKLFGTSISVGLYMNVFFYAGAVVALYFIALRFMGPNTAFMSAAIYALWPNNISYSVSLSSEPMYVFFLFSGLAIFINGLQTRGTMLFVSISLSGIVLGLSQAVRPVTVIFIFSIALVLILFYHNNKPASNNSCTLKHKLILFSTLILAFVITLWGLGLYTSKILPTISKPSYGWSLFEGANINTYGQWDPVSSAIQDTIVAEYPLEQVQTIFLQMGIDRIKSYDSNQLANLLAIKTKNVFGNGDYFNRDLNIYVTSQPTIIQSGSVPRPILAWGDLSFWLYRILAFYFMYICFKCLYLTLIKKETGKVNRLFCMILPVCGIMTIHLLLTSIERYNYPAIPIMIMICMLFSEKYPYDSCKKDGALI
jgi:4-amino-4-deoxy-L-arabinose transferase-like glycosyltransferase